jgi:hypothetical protein
MKIDQFKIQLKTVYNIQFNFKFCSKMVPWLVIAGRDSDYQLLTLCMYQLTEAGRGGDVIVYEGNVREWKHGLLWFTPCTSQSSNEPTP